MADLLTQLQDAVDQLANQFVASLFYVHKHHDYQKLNPNDTIRQEPKNEEGVAPTDPDVTPDPADVFKAAQRELAQDLILKEQQIEYLISSLPGLGNSEKDQEHMIRTLEEELKVAEDERRGALMEKEEVLGRLEGVIRGIKRP
ncbi:hypothetical protein LZ554_002119 [Drepanopeziza brunnea f. sp. 'monogermtubi']|nr:hypothetical protein LZ554_002119 [Drepanopeziza brunnea f. sp. 'monogermtubi']